jgi:hypothetical protein
MATKFIAEAWTEFAIATLFIGPRFYFRYTHTGRQGLGWDDLLMVFAGVSAESLPGFPSVTTDMYSYSTSARPPLHT